MIHLLHHHPKEKEVRETILSQEEFSRDVFSAEVFFLHDDYSVGDISDLDTGGENRNLLWQSLEPFLSTKNEKNPYQLDLEVLQLIAEKLEQNKEEVICVWFANNAPETAFYLRVLAYFQKWQHQFKQIHIDNLPFFTDTGRVSFPKQMAEIETSELSKCKHLLRQPSNAEIEIDLSEWQSFFRFPLTVRALKNTKLLEVSDVEDIFDTNIKQMLKLHPKPVRLSKIVKDIQKKIGPHHEAMILERIHTLINSGVLAYQSGKQDEKEKYFIENEVVLVSTPQVAPIHE